MYLLGPKKPSLENSDEKEALQPSLVPPIQPDSVADEEVPQDNDKVQRGKKKKKTKRVPDDESTDEEVVSTSHPVNRRTGRRARRTTRQTQVIIRAPDLPTRPMLAVTKNPKQSNPPIHVREEKSVEKGVEVVIKAHLYKASPGGLPVEYEFKTRKGTVRLSYTFMALTNPLDRPILSMSCLER